MIKEESLYILLDIVSRNGSVRRLTRRGIDFVEVAKITDEAVKRKFLEVGDKNVVLTKLGSEHLAELAKKFKKTNKNEWIEVDRKSKIAKLGKNIIFVPNQNELTFLSDKDLEQ